MWASRAAAFCSSKFTRFLILPSPHLSSRWRTWVLALCVILTLPNRRRLSARASERGKDGLGERVQTVGTRVTVMGDAAELERPQTAGSPFSGRGMKLLSCLSSFWMLHGQAEVDWPRLRRMSCHLFAAFSAVPLSPFPCVKAPQPLFHPSPLSPSPPLPPLPLSYGR